MAPFEFDGRQYAAASKHQREWGNRIVAGLDLAGDEHVLDLGCGNGALTAQLAERVPRGRVHGIDASESMIEAAREHVRPNLVFQRLDINDIDFYVAFDLVFSNATLHWITDHRRLLANVYRALRPGGRVRFNFAGNGNCATFNATVRVAMQLSESATAFAGFAWPWYMPSVDAYESLVAESAFVDVSLWSENADRYFADADEMTRWVDQPSLVPFLAYLPAPLRQPFRDEVVARMISATQHADGTCFETFRRINLAARRP